MGKRITAARNAKGWSLQYVAARLGVSKATVGHWETGARAIKHGDLAALFLEFFVYSLLTRCVYCV
jgi:transcriptional regulator with XRE-family HTH domain